MSDNGVIEYMPSLEVPVAGFACRSNRVFIEASTVLSAVARITFSDVRTYLPGRSVQLVCNSNGTAIFCKASYVVPAKIGEKQAKTISFHFPERIFTDRSRNACFPFCVGHSHLALSLHLAPHSPLTIPRHVSLITHQCGFMSGKRITSRMLSAPLSIIISRSIPIPIPPAGGIPYRSAVRKSSSTFCFSASSPT